MLKDFFDSIVCLTLENRKDRQNTVKREFRTLQVQPEWFFAVSAIGPHQSFNLSMKAILTRFYESGKERLLVFEDDVTVKDKDHLEQALNELPEDWDIVYLGANILDEEPERFSDHLFRIKSAWTTHAIGYSRKGVEAILKDFPDESVRMYDNHLGDILGGLNAFVVAPMVCWQNAGHSDIWNTQVNYNSIFRESQKKLR